MAAARAFSETLPPKPRHRIRAAWHFLRQEFADALHEHESLAAVYPEDWQTHFDMGEMAFALYDYSRAVGEYQNAISLNSTHLASHLGLSQAELFRGNTLSARRAWERAQSMDPQDPRVLCARAQLDLIDNNVGAALSGLQKMSAASSPASRSRGNYLLAQVQIYGGRFQSALATLESGIAEDRQNGDAVSESRKRLARVQIQALLGNTAAVSAECAKTTASTGDIATLVAFGSLCANSGSLPATRLILSQIESRPDSPSKGRHLELLRGEIALAAGRPEEAIAAFIKARALHPGHPPLADLARSYALAGRHEEAAKEYKELSEQKAPVLFPADSPWFSAAWVSALFDAGRLALKAGNRQEAQQYLRNYLWALDGADPELPKLQEAKALLRGK